jgi:hypothetical protein
MAKQASIINTARTAVVAVETLASVGESTITTVGGAARASLAKRLGRMAKALEGASLPTADALDTVANADLDKADALAPAAVKRAKQTVQALRETAAERELTEAEKLKLAKARQTANAASKASAQAILALGLRCRLQAAGLLLDVAKGVAAPVKGEAA